MQQWLFEMTIGPDVYVLELAERDGTGFTNQCIETKRPIVAGSKSLLGRFSSEKPLRDTGCSEAK